MMRVSNTINQTHGYSRCGRPWKASSSMKSKELAVNNLGNHGTHKTVSMVSEFESLHIKAMAFHNTITTPSKYL